MILPNIWKNKKCSKPPTSHYTTSYAGLITIFPMVSYSFMGKKKQQLSGRLLLCSPLLHHLLFLLRETSGIFWGSWDDQRNNTWWIMMDIWYIIGIYIYIGYIYMGHLWYPQYGDGIQWDRTKQQYELGGWARRKMVGLENGSDFFVRLPTWMAALTMFHEGH